MERREFMFIAFCCRYYTRKIFTFISDRKVLLFLTYRILTSLQVIPLYTESNTSSRMYIYINGKIRKHYQYFADLCCISVGWEFP